MSFSLIVTVGPSILNKENLLKIFSAGDCIFRINGAHADKLSALSYLRRLREVLPSSRIMIDLPGNKVRTCNLAEPIRLQKGFEFSLDKMNINYPEFHTLLKNGDKVYANDSNLRLEVTNIREGLITFKSNSDGVLMSNKGLHVHGVNDSLPFLFARDLDLIKLAIEEDIDYLSLSYVRNLEDILEVKSIIQSSGRSELTIVAKIETKSAVKNLAQIIREVDHINVDRGDLASDIGLSNLPLAQQLVLDAGLREGKKVFLATQFLKSMETNPVPYIAECIDLYKTISSGVSGIQLSEETAVGVYPVECVNFVFETLMMCDQAKRENIQNKFLVKRAVGRLPVAGQI